MKEMLLNQKAYEILTGQKQQELFKAKTGLILKKVQITQKQIESLGLSKDSEQKMFYVTKEGIGRIYGDIDTFSKYLSDEKVLEGAVAAGYK